MAYVIVKIEFPNSHGIRELPAFVYGDACKIQKLTVFAFA